LALLFVRRTGVTPAFVIQLLLLPKEVARKARAFGSAGNNGFLPRRKKPGKKGFTIFPFLKFVVPGHFGSRCEALAVYRKVNCTLARYHNHYCCGCLFCELTLSSRSQWDLLPAIKGSFCILFTLKGTRLALRKSMIYKSLVRLHV